MYTRCLVCATAFEPNDQLEHLPNGQRVAFDPGRGRLWVVCPTCRRWSLAPIEDRWEALEELAEIVDGELSPLPTIETMRRRITGRG